MREYHYYIYDGENIPFEEGLFLADGLRQAYQKINIRCKSIRKEGDISFSRVVLRTGARSTDLSALFSNAGS